MIDYDSTSDTLLHIREVQARLSAVINNLIMRGYAHDATKLHDPEKAVFDEFTPKLRDSTYGSDEYKAFLDGMGEGLRHHYAHNSHHPEHYEDGIDGMCLLDVIEMLADWKAATLRHADGDLARSIEQNQERFGYDDRFKGLLHRTADRLGWLASTGEDNG